MVIDGGELGETWSSLVHPGRAIPPDASAVHGITDAMVEGAPPPETVAAELRRRCGDETLVFHNYPFDLPFLAALLRAGSAPPFYNPVVDTLGLARGLMGPGGNSLGALAARLGRCAHHRATPPQAGPALGGEGRGAELGRAGGPEPGRAPPDRREARRGLTARGQPR